MTLKIKKPAVLLIGGPMDGWAYYTTDAEAKVLIGERTGKPFPYAPTGERRVHPRTNGQVTSDVWGWTG